jgi:hypothetical protein
MLVPLCIDQEKGALTMSGISKKHVASMCMILSAICTVLMDENVAMDPRDRFNAPSQRSQQSSRKLCVAWLHRHPTSTGCRGASAHKTLGFAHDHIGTSPKSVHHPTTIGRGNEPAFIMLRLRGGSPQQRAKDGKKEQDPGKVPTEQEKAQMKRAAEKQRKRDELVHKARKAGWKNPEAAAGLEHMDRMSYDEMIEKFK